MTDKVYTIGEFAAINKISARMLRHYDKIGLLKPLILAGNGYRMYSAEQISKTALIKKYRACTFSLNEIALLLGGGVNISKMAYSKIEELKQQEILHKEAIQRLYQFLDIDGAKGFDNLYEISLTHKNRQLLLCKEHFCSEREIEEGFDKLYELLDEKKISPAGFPTLLSGIFEGQGFKPAVAVKEKFEETGYEFLIQDEGEYLSTLHYGDYYELGCAYDKLVSYAGVKELCYSSLFIERYFLDSTRTADSNEYITEVSVKITP